MDVSNVIVSYCLLQLNSYPQLYCSIYWLWSTTQGIVGWTV